MVRLKRSTCYVLTTMTSLARAQTARGRRWSDEAASLAEIAQYSLYVLRIGAYGGRHLH